MLEFLIRGLAAFFALLYSVALAQAQTPVEIELDAPFVHERSGIIVPATIGRFERTSVDDLTKEQLNIAIQLREPSQDTELTLYIYRAATPNISIWGDFAVLAMVNNPAVGELATDSYFMGRFDPPNNSGPGAGLHASALVEGKDAKSTALSMFAHNDWIVKLRATSKTLTDEAITALIGRVLANLEMDESETTYPPVTFIEPCEKPLQFEKDLTIKGLALTDGVVMALAVNEIRIAAKVSDNPGKPWCFDPQSTLDYGVYREVGSKTEYFVALSDAGIGAYVGRFRKTLISTRLSGYLVKTSDGATEKAWPVFDDRVHPAFIKSRYGSVTPIATLDVRPGAEPRSTIVLPPTN